MPQRRFRWKIVNGTVGIDEIVRHEFPKKRIEDRAHLLRAWVRNNSLIQHGRPPTDDEVNADYERLQKWRFSPHGPEAKMMADQLFNFANYFFEERRKERAKKAANTRWHPNTS